MKTTTAFTIYNASAGAGKTYTLVREYLLRLFSQVQTEGYKTILAVTFTNKAVAEMKNRIIQYLQALSQEAVCPRYQPMLQELATATALDQNSIRKKAKKILKSIVHNYASFDVVTIDTFTHRLIRTFANDLDIPMNFEVEMDLDSLLNESVDRLIAKVGKEKYLTDLLLSFALSKLDNDKSWDIHIELYQVAKLLLDENQRKQLGRIKNKNYTDFEAYKKTVSQHLVQVKKELESQTKTLFELFEQKGLQAEDFYRKYIPNHFEALQLGKVVSFEAKWKQEIESTPFYTKTLAPAKKETIDAIRPQIEAVFCHTKKLFFERELWENVQKNLVPLSVLNAIHTQLDFLKKERNLLLIAEFNSIISRAIAGQPAPFIYERLGERYRDYFIDEFQDTSELQWHNMIPLIDHALASEGTDGNPGSLTLVGDAKQAIYRWRGGKPEQFIALAGSENPFLMAQKANFELPKNYRSYSEIIHFNNTFFTHLAQDFSAEVHQKLYLQGNQQETNSNQGGYVQLSFVEAENVADAHQVYPSKVYEAILALQQNGYGLEDLCILTRKRDQGVVIANYLATKGIPLISSETLLINNAPEISCIISLLQLYVQPKHKLARLRVLHFLAKQLEVSEPSCFVAQFLALSVDQFEKELAKHHIRFSFDRLHSLPLYESVEYIIRVFYLHTSASAYVQFFLDVVFDFAQKKATGVSGFLDYWEQKKEKLSIVVPEGKPAVRIMTIHQSKGLEFPVVLYPYANEALYRQRDTKIWYPIPGDQFNGFEQAYINYSPKVSQYGAVGSQLVEQFQSEQELDAINILYVALTRAVEQLYIFTKKELGPKATPNLKMYSGKFISYLQSLGIWDAAVMDYTFGNPRRSRSQPTKRSNIQTKTPKSLCCTAKELHQIRLVTHDISLWEGRSSEDREKGVIFHELMAQVQIAADVPKVLSQATAIGILTAIQQKQLLVILENMTTHPELISYFDPDKKILNEREILVNGAICRPDRLVIEGQKVTILDYKTGAFSANHQQQILQYATALRAMGYTIDKCILVYIFPEIQVKIV